MESQSKRFLPDRLDLGVGLSVLILLIAIGIVVLRGDQIGISVENYGPQTSGSTRASIRVTFDEPLVPQTVDGSISLVPPIQGKLAVTNNELSFLPAQPLTQGQEY